MVPCPECLGTGKRLKAGNPNLTVRCSECEAKGVIPCPDCGGRGGLVATPKQNEGSPTTGKIVSIGPLVPEEKRKVGDRVLFSSYAGTRHDVGAKTREGKEKTFELRIIRDDEVLMKIHGLLKLRQLKGMIALHTNA